MINLLSRLTFDHEKFSVHYSEFDNEQLQFLFKLLYQYEPYIQQYMFPTAQSQFCSCQESLIKLLILDFNELDLDPSELKAIHNDLDLSDDIDVIELYLCSNCNFWTVDTNR